LEKQLTRNIFGKNESALSSNGSPLKDLALSKDISALEYKVFGLESPFKRSAFESPMKKGLSILSPLTLRATEIPNNI
jgi:hypothetical protein